MINKEEVIETLVHLDNETTLLSFHDTRHPLYQKLISYGKEIVPILLEHLRTDQDLSSACKSPRGAWWCIVALRQLTQQNPIKKGHEGRLKEIIKDWLEDDHQQPKINTKSQIFYWPI